MQYPVTIPETIEREYMVLRKRLIGGVSEMFSDALDQVSYRFDAEDEELPPDLVELLAVLGITIGTVLNETRLRKRLRVLANHITQKKLVELTQVLGKPVTKPSPETIERWIAEQTRAINDEVEALLQQADEQVREGLKAGKSLAAIRSEIEQKSRATGLTAAAAGSAAVLALNAAVNQEIAQGAGSTHYRWVTTLDERTRPWHAELHNTIQAWDSEPVGGACSASFPGHPGSCPSCRCLAIPLAGEYVRPSDVTITLQAGDYKKLL